MASLLADAPLSITPETAQALLAEHYGVPGVATALPGDRDRNFRIRTADGELMLKVAHPAEKPSVLETHQRALRHIGRWDSTLPIPEPVAAVDGGLIASAQIDGVGVALRVTTFLPGDTIETIGWNPALRIDAMAVLARLDSALRSFVPDDLGAPPEWHIGALPALRPHLDTVGPGRRALAEQWIDRFEAAASPLLPELRTQPVHGDFNPANLVVDAASPDWLSGVIDFGDMSIAPLVADPAIAAGYMSLGDPDPVGTIAGAAATYHACAPLTAAELQAFALLSVGRLVQSVLISSWRAALHPENRDYILIHAEPIWETLQRLGSAEDVTQEVIASADPPRHRPSRTAALAQRRKYMGRGLRLSYAQPLRLMSGKGVWLTDTDGRRYLDAYNNVAQVGHGHPAVVAAITRQAQRLNTNTRYVVDDIAEFAARLTDLLPDPLDTVYFANSGSEANDLAWRIARTVTGRRGMIVTDNAYHGSTDLTISTSPEELGHHRLPDWVETVPAPLPGAETANIAVAIDCLADHGLAAFACDTVFSSDGICAAPSGWLADVYRQVRARGGLCIADEVQAGYGRVGPHFWGFATDRAVPDIVTIGKPMGNGHPVAAVITSGAIAERFAGAGYYFSTFAGNPVSVAAARAVLEITQREQLADRAAETGDYLRTGLAELFGAEATIRGPGLFIGVELSDDAGMPDAKTAARVQNAMRAGGVLIGRTGPDHNVLKIRPPLVFEIRHADILLEVLSQIL